MPLGSVFGALRLRLRNRPDSEHEQALVRLRDASGKLRPAAEIRSGLQAL